MAGPAVKTATAVIRKDGKKSLKGVVVKKKTKPIAAKVSPSPGDPLSKDDEKDETNDLPQPKRRKVSGA